MISDATPPFPIPQIMPSSGVEGALILVAIVAGCVLVGLLLRFFWPQDDAPASTTDTPETDDAVARWAVRRDATTIIECSRRLERKLDQARQELTEERLNMLQRLAEANKTAEEMRLGRMECAQQLEEANAELGNRTDEPSANGSVYAQLRWWKDRSDELHDTIEMHRETNRQVTSALDEARAEIARLRHKDGALLQSYGTIDRQKNALNEQSREIARLRRAREE